MRHLMSPLDFSVEELDRLLDLAGDIEKNQMCIRDRPAAACEKPGGAGTDRRGRFPGERRL